MNWLFEQPLIIVVLGMLLILALGAAWSASGRQELLYALGVAFILLIAGLVTERLVVTDSEAIRATLLQIARDVQSNNRRAVARHVYSGAPALKQKADAELPNYEFTECRVTQVHTIDVDRLAEPRSAIVEFNVVASGTFKYMGDRFSDTGIPRWVKLHLVREKDGRWTIQEYEHAEPTRGLLNQPIGK
jgi:hypothetical protein